MSDDPEGAQKPGTCKGPEPNELVEHQATLPGFT
jgi:hypothetical protein